MDAIDINFNWYIPKLLTTYETSVRKATKENKA